jgi:hypothetical protein
LLPEPTLVAKDGYDGYITREHAEAAYGPFSKRAALITTRWRAAGASFAVWPHRASSDAPGRAV